MVNDPENAELTPKQAKFCLEYVRDYNGTLAAIRAGYARPGARVEACRLLTNANIRKEIKRLQAEHAERVAVSLERLDEELLRIAHFDPKNLFDEDGRAIPIQDLDESVSSVIAGLEVVDYLEEKVQQGTLRKYKLPDKKGAIELLYKRRGAIEDKSTIKFDLSNLTEEELNALEAIQSKMVS